MDRSIRISVADSVPDTARVCHYDELDESAKERFPTLLECSNVTCDPALVEILARYDYVKFTEYYSLKRTGVKARDCAMD